MAAKDSIKNKIMPELPEVETVKRQLAKRLQNTTIIKVDLLHSGREFPAGNAFLEAAQGQEISSIERRAKLLIWRFQGGDALIAHLKMTGRFVFVDASYTPTKHDHVLFSFRKGSEAFSLAWADVRKFGFLKFVKDEELNKILTVYGPEPLEVSSEELAVCLETASRRAIKTLLLDQAVIAGIGNIYADEALHRAGIHPTRHASELSSHERTSLAKEVQSILHESIAQQGTSANDYVDTEGKRGGFLSLLRVYSRKDEPCLTCGTRIQRVVIGQRGTHYCAICQK